MTSNVSVPASADPSFLASLDAVRPELEQLTDTERATINIDIPGAVVTALGCAPELKRLRARVAELPGFDHAKFDRLETYARAAGQAHAEYIAASTPGGAIQAIAAELSKTREVLNADVTALAKRGLLDGSRLQELRGTTGFKNIAFDVLALTSMLRKSWSSVAQRTGVRMEEIERAEALANQLASETGVREQGNPGGPEATLTRARAFTLFTRVYDQARRAVIYLRWNEGDADAIVPSLWRGRGGSRRKDEPEDVATGSENPVVVAPAVGGTVATGAGTSSPFVSSGLPGEDPLMR